MNIYKSELDKIQYCEICEYDCFSVCPIYKITENEILKPKFKVLKAKATLKDKDFKDKSFIYACLNCNNCKVYCPHSVDVSEILSFTKEKIINFGMADFYIYNFEEEFYKSLKNIKITQFDKYVLIDNLPDFLRFYNLGFRDETVSEINNLFESVKSKKIKIKDAGFVYLIKKIKKNLKKVPKIICSCKDEDYYKILLSFY